MQQLCGIMKDNQVALPSDIEKDISAIFHRAPNIEMYICDVMFYRDTVLREQVYKDSFSVIFSFRRIGVEGFGQKPKNVVGKGRLLRIRQRSV